MLNDLSTPASLLATRRSAKPRDLVAPGPDDAGLARILAAAMRTPDHGKLAPWRFLIVRADRRAALAQLLRRAFLADKPDATALDLETVDLLAHTAPTLVVAISSPEPGKIPLWEQELSAGAACMNLLLAAHAEGYAGGWLTTWAAYSAVVAEGLGLAAGERIAGFMFIGSLDRPPQERPRPELAERVAEWPG